MVAVPVPRPSITLTPLAAVNILAAAWDFPCSPRIRLIIAECDACRRDRFVWCAERLFAFFDSQVSANDVTTELSGVTFAFSADVLSTGLSDIEIDWFQKADCNPADIARAVARRADIRLRYAMSQGHFVSDLSDDAFLDLASTGSVGLVVTVKGYRPRAPKRLLNVINED